jgi:hypothetical protein
MAQGGNATRQYSNVQVSSSRAVFLLSQNTDMAVAIIILVVTNASMSVFPIIKRTVAGATTFIGGATTFIGGEGVGAT